MRNIFVLLSVLLAQLVLAQVHHDQHGRLHAHAHAHAKREEEAEIAERDEVYEVEWVTVTHYVTINAGRYTRTIHYDSLSPTLSSTSVDPASTYSTTAKTTTSTKTSTKTTSSSVAVAPVYSSSTTSSSVAVAPTTTSSSAHTTTSSSSSPSPYTTSSSTTTLKTTTSKSTTTTSKSTTKSTTTSKVATTTTTKATATTSAASSSGISLSNLSPNGRKAGLSGYIGIGTISGFKSFAPYISWYSDYTATTPDVGAVMGIPMLWGASGSPCTTTTSRLAGFDSLKTTPKIMFGFFEPDCTCEMSAQMSTKDAAAAWDTLLVPLANKGTILGSPSMCTQYDESFLTPFNGLITKSWDVTSIHINKPNLSEAQKDVDYYVKKYGKPIWVSEFACVHDNPSWAPCTDQTEIDTFINDVVPYFQSNPNVVAYGPSNGEGLGTVWPMTDSTTGALTATGQTYLAAIKAIA